MPDLKLAASLLAADFARLAEQVGAVEDHVEMLHLDIMDGHFVPNISFGIPVISSLRRCSKLIFDCHLMTSNPDAFLPELREAGADLVTVHIEAATNPEPVLAQAREVGLGFGLAISPNTPWEAVEPFAEDCQMILVMSVQPGFGGQRFLDHVLTKVETARKWVETRGLSTDIQIDGGIGVGNIRLARDAGVNVFVAGTAIFGAPDPGVAADELRGIIQ